MYRTINGLITMAFIFVFAFSLNAQEEKRPHGLSAQLLSLDHASPYFKELADPSNNTLGLKIAYNRYFNDWILLSVPFEAAVINLPDDPFDNMRSTIGLDALVKVRYFNEDRFLVPHVYTGIGFTTEFSGDTYPQLPVGAGLSFKIGPWGYIILEGGYRYTLNQDLKNKDHIQYGLGFSFILGKSDLALLNQGDNDIIPPKVNKMMDADKDGIADKEDKCPNLAGTVETGGCPDADGDKVSDDIDKCPDIPGTMATMGCPDADNDGVADAEDKCPNLAGKLFGCPDTDGDGFNDAEDKCPARAGILNGCPDTDGDGVADNEDKCPTSAGLLKFKGCPDSDNDGVVDNEDSCPNEKGSASNNGCPEIKAADKAVLVQAMQDVNFETGSNQLTIASFGLLDQVAMILRSYPYYNVSINGHTDNVGDENKNMSLSENRAKSCYDYLISKGIESYRLSYAGYGETSPIADNGTALGRRRNRRVEFSMYVRKN